MNVEVFVEMLFGISLFTGLFTEAFKTIFDENGFKYSSNILAGVIAIILSIFSTVAYVIFNEITFDTSWFLCLISLMGLSWLSAMVGFDKVVQTIKQLGGK